ncbi:MAG: hypothetical protein ACAH80_12540 [Alphaproteobacteria bacterium]
MAQKDDYGRPTLTESIAPGPRHGEARHEDNMYAHFGNKQEPVAVKPPTILEKALIDIAKMEPKMAGETAIAMTTLMGRTMDQHHASGAELEQKQMGVVNTFLFDTPASPAGKNILMQMTVEQVTGEPYKAPGSTGPTATLNSPKAK